MTTWRDIISANYSDYQQLLVKSRVAWTGLAATYGDNDARTEFFAKFNELMIWLLVQFDDFIDTQTPSKNKISKHQKLDVKGNEIVISQFDTTNRASFFTNLMFAAEHLMKSVLDKYGQNQNQMYGKTVTAFLAELNISDNQKERILRLPAEIRNSLHNNGYTKDDIPLTILRGRTFVANKADQLQFTGWDNLYIVVDELIDLLYNIVTTSKVSNEKNIPKKPHFII